MSDPICTYCGKPFLEGEHWIHEVDKEEYFHRDACFILSHIEPRIREIVREQIELLADRIEHSLGVRP